MKKFLRKMLGKHWKNKSDYWMKDIANDKLLKVAAIYGANASGKSNIYDAFAYMSYYVAESFKFGDEEDGRRKAKSQYVKALPFLLDNKSRNEETTFEVFFVDNLENTGKTYQYGFSLEKNIKQSFTGKREKN